VKQDTNIKQKLANRLLSKKAAKITRNKSKMNFETAKTALILMDGLDSKSEKPIMQFVSFLKENKVQVDRLSYFNQKEPVRDPGDSEIILNRKNLNWLGFPKTNENIKLLEKEYDMLFDFSMKEYFPIRCLVLLSKARFKIGIMQEKRHPYDFMIDLGKDRQVNEFIYQLKKYLPLLK
jgi:hypothetical protein